MCVTFLLGDFSSDVKETGVTCFSVQFPPNHFGLNMSPFHSTNQLHKELDILKVKDVYKSCVLKFVFLCLNHTPLRMFNNYFQKRQTLHDRNLRDMKTLHVPVGYSDLALSSTKINGAKLWNKLPLEIKRNDDVGCFKKSVKSHFMKSYT